MSRNIFRPPGEGSDRSVLPGLGWRKVSRCGRAAAVAAYSTGSKRAWKKRSLRRLVDESQPPDLVAALVEADDALGHGAHVVVGVDPARDGQAHQLQRRAVVLAGLGVAALGDVAALHGAHAGLDVDLGRQRLGRELVLVDVRQEALGVEEDRVAARAA